MSLKFIAVPAHAKVSKEAKEGMQAFVTEFIRCVRSSWKVYTEYPCQLRYVGSSRQVHGFEA
jgi:hypothetical protein